MKSGGGNYIGTSYIQKILKRTSLKNSGRSACLATEDLTCCVMYTTIRSPTISAPLKSLPEPSDVIIGRHVLRYNSVNFLLGMCESAKIILPTRAIISDQPDCSTPHLSEGSMGGHHRLRITAPLNSWTQLDTWLLVIQDRFIKWVELCPLRRVTAPVISQQLIERMFAGGRSYWTTAANLSRSDYSKCSASGTVPCTRSIAIPWSGPIKSRQ